MKVIKKKKVRERKKFYKEILLNPSMKKEVILIIIFIITISFVSASFSVGNVSHSINKEYPPNGDITGWINISFNNEPLDSFFSDSLGNSIKLKDLLSKNSLFEHNCSTIGCREAYTIMGSGAIEKNFALNEGSSNIIGFSFTGNIKEIKSVDFDITSSAGASCKNQLKIDFLDDGVFEMGNNKSSFQTCSEKNYSCFEINSAKEEYVLGTTPYCQKITLGEGAGFDVGAWIKKAGEGSSELWMWLYDGNTKVASCILPEANEIGEEISCTIDYLITKPKDYYLCIYSTAGGIYRTRGNVNPSTKCGFHSLPPGTGDSTYQIFFQQIEFAPVDTLEIKNILPNKQDISSMIEDYIIDRYGSLNCVDKECIVPINITSGKDQTILINNLEVVYEKNADVVMNEFYNLNEGASKISSGFQKFNLDEGNFSAPSDYGNFSFELKLDNQKIFSEILKVSKMPFIKNLVPKTTALGYATLFRVEVNASGANITKYEWDFDGDKKTTTKNEVSYTYQTLGAHSATITITDSNNNKISKKFQITVETPEKQINLDIIRIEDSLTNIKEEIKTFPIFYRDGLDSILKFNTTESLLQEIKEKYSTATSEEDYLHILSLLSRIEIPESIYISESADPILFFPSKENINLNILKEISGGDYNLSDEQKYVEAIISWNFQNIESKISFEGLSSIKDREESPLLKFFELGINNKAETDTYLIIEKMENFMFEENYNELETDNYYYIKLDQGDNKIVFSTTEDIGLDNLPVFISPGISDLKVIDISPGEKEGIKWGWIILAIFLLLLIAYIVYIILQQWYKTRYETHLFKDRNHLFNLVTYINNQRNMGVTDEEIAKTLKKAKWESEQVTYAMKKYAGKRTVMFELPFLRIFSKKKPIQNMPYRGVPSPGSVNGPFPKRGPF